MESAYALHRNTPTIAVIDSRGLAVACVAYYRKNNSDAPPEARVARETFDVAGRSVANWDARLGAGPAPVASMIRIRGLSGASLLTVSVDAGWRLTLPDEAAQVRQSWDEAGNTARFEYDSMGRPLNVEEGTKCVERLYYGAPGTETSARNQCGRLIRHMDTAGAHQMTDYSLQGKPIAQSRRFLVERDHPGWPWAENQQDALLEQGADKTYISRWQYDASGGVLDQMDAATHTRRYAYSVQGQLQSAWLKVAGKREHLLVSDIAYNAFGQVEYERAGNGVISSSVFDPADGRLQLLLACKGAWNLQELHYDYDPVGNILCLTDKSQPVSWFANQRIEPISRYRYDSLYQLVSATGREVASAVNGPALPALISPLDPSRLQPYSQSWSYDAGGNLLEQHHSNRPTHLMDIAPDSNRGLTRVKGQTPDFGASFDGNGNLKLLAPGQPMRWTARNQLSEVQLVSREDGLDDSECYVYDGAGMRVRKVRHALAASVTRITEVRYLPGLEIRTEGTDSPDEVLHVINIQVGRSSVRLLHWEQGQPGGIDEDQVRYSQDDHLGSSTLELDHRGNLISYEGYYAYGGTAWWMGLSQVEADYKCIRYSGKERDATGLYYYGFRYYASWLQRWISPDPGGIVDGLNMFYMAGNNPVTHQDVMGLYSGKSGDYQERIIEQDSVIVGRGRARMPPAVIEFVDHAFEIADILVSEAVVAMQETGRARRPIDQTLKLVFSNLHRRSELESRFQVLKTAIQLYRTGVRHDELAFVKSKESSDSTLASVVGKDPLKRIFIRSRSWKDTSRRGAVLLATTLIHEISHLDLQTKDNYYYASPGARSMTDESYWESAINEAEMVSSGRYDTEIIKNIEESKLGSTSLQAMFGEKSLERIKAGFHGFRADSLYHNADSYSQASVLLGLPVLDERLGSRRERYSAPPPEPKPDY
jgi:insecticidal toxin complex protein TccC